MIKNVKYLLLGILGLAVVSLPKRRGYKRNLVATSNN